MSRRREPRLEELLEYPAAYGVASDAAWRLNREVEPATVAARYLSHRLLLRLKRSDRDVATAAGMSRALGRDQGTPMEKRYSGSQPLSLEDVLAFALAGDVPLRELLPERLDELFPPAYRPLLRHWDGHSYPSFDASSAVPDWPQVVAGVSEWVDAEVEAGRGHLLLGEHLLRATALTLQQSGVAPALMSFRASEAGRRRALFLRGRNSAAVTPVVMLSDQPPTAQTVADTLVGLAHSGGSPRGLSVGVWAISQATLEVLSDAVPALRLRVARTGFVVGREELSRVLQDVPAEGAVSVDFSVEGEVLASAPLARGGVVTAIISQKISQ